jgi:hypothetical protein
VVLVVAACGTGGGGGDGPNVGQDITASFTPEMTAVTPNSVSLQMKEAQDDFVTLEVVATALSMDPFGVAFDIEFDPAVASFDSFREGNYWGTSGSITYQVRLQENTSDRLIVGITRQGNAALSTSTGNGVLLELQFKAIAVGASTLAFSNNNLVDHSGQFLSAAWSAGIINGS